MTIILNVNCTSENRTGFIFPGSKVNGTLSMTLDKPHHLVSIELKLAGETVTRRVIRHNEGNQIKTDRTILLQNDTILRKTFCSGQFAETFEKGTHGFPFDFQLDVTFPASLSGPIVSTFYSVKQKYEVSYFMEAVVTEKVSGCFGGSSNTTNEVFPITVYEMPNLSLYQPMFQRKPYVSSGEAEIYQGCFEQPGLVKFTVTLPKLYVTAGKPLPFSVHLENLSKKTIIGLEAQLQQNVTYYVRSYYKDKQNTITTQGFDTKIQPGTSLQIDDLQIQIPSTLSGTTPSFVTPRKITIEYELALILFAGGEKKLFCEQILVSNLDIDSMI